MTRYWQADKEAIAHELSFLLDEEESLSFLRLVSYFKEWEKIVREEIVDKIERELKCTGLGWSQCGGVNQEHCHYLDQVIELIDGKPKNTLPLELSEEKGNDDTR